MDSEIVATGEFGAAVVVPGASDLAPTSSTRLRWFELALVLLVAFSNYVVTSVAVLVGFRDGVHPGAFQHGRWGLGLLQELIALLLLGYVLSRRGLRLRDLGLRWSGRELGAGVLLTIGAYAAYLVGLLLW